MFLRMNYSWNVTNVSRINECRINSGSGNNTDLFDKDSKFENWNV